MRGRKTKTFILGGDVGGTKTNLGLFLRGRGRPLLKAMETYPNKEADGLDQIIQQFIEHHPAPISAACFGIAGPVVNGRCKATNLPWDVSEIDLKKRFKWRQVRLINDLTAAALAIPVLTGREIMALNSARIRKDRNIGLIAPGTGLGQAFLIPKDDHYIPVSTEGGHADFPPNSEDEIDLWRYLHSRFGHVSIERVLSGPGLINIYSWLKESGRLTEPEWLGRRFKQMDPAKVVTEAAVNNKEPGCLATLEMFISILGSVAGNLALTGLTAGGLYLGGGIPPKILPLLMEGPFLKAFTEKGRFSELLKKIPVRVILNDRAALLGAAFWAILLCDRESELS